MVWIRSSWAVSHDACGPECLRTAVDWKANVATDSILEFSALCAGFDPRPKQW
jgi:hypothetical protein